MEQLKKLRSLLNYTQQEMADKIGVSKSLYEKIESGEKKPSREFITKMKKSFPFLDINIFFELQSHELQS